MQNIDIVIAWVDGNDLELKKKRHKYLTGEDASDAVSATRFASNNEIYYNIASILKYVPFCRNIYVVADSQRPEFIDEFAAQGCALPIKFVWLITEKFLEVLKSIYRPSIPVLLKVCFGILKAYQIILFI